MLKSISCTNEYCLRKMLRKLRRLKKNIVVQVLQGAGWKMLQGMEALSARTPRLVLITRLYHRPPTLRPAIRARGRSFNIYLCKTASLSSPATFLTGAEHAIDAIDALHVKAHLQVFNWFLFSMLSCWKDKEGELEVSFFLTLFCPEKSFPSYKKNYPSTNKPHMVSFYLYQKWQRLAQLINVEQSVSRQSGAEGKRIFEINRNQLQKSCNHH